MKSSEAVNSMDPDQSLKGMQILRSLLSNGPINDPFSNGGEVVEELGKKSEVQSIPSHDANEVGGEIGVSDHPPKTIACEDTEIVDSNAAIACDNVEIVDHGTQDEPTIKPDANSHQRSSSDGGRKTRSKKSAVDESVSAPTDDLVASRPPSSNPDDINEATSLEATSSPETIGRKTRNTRTKSALKRQLRMRRGQKLTADIVTDGQSCAPLARLESPSANVEKVWYKDGVIW